MKLNLKNFQESLWKDCNKHKHLAYVALSMYIIMFAAYIMAAIMGATIILMGILTGSYNSLNPIIVSIVLVFCIFVIYVSYKISKVMIYGIRGRKL